MTTRKKTVSESALYKHIRLKVQAQDQPSKEKLRDFINEWGDPEDFPGLKLAYENNEEALLALQQYRADRTSGADQEPGYYDGEPTAKHKRKPKAKGEVEAGEVTEDKFEDSEEANEEEDIPAIEGAAEKSEETDRGSQQNLDDAENGSGSGYSKARFHEDVRDGPEDDISSNHKQARSYATTNAMIKKAQTLTRTVANDDGEEEESNQTITPRAKPTSRPRKAKDEKKKERKTAATITASEMDKKEVGKPSNTPKNKASNNKQTSAAKPRVKAEKNAVKPVQPSKKNRASAAGTLVKEEEQAIEPVKRNNKREAFAARTQVNEETDVKPTYTRLRGDIRVTAEELSSYSVEVTKASRYIIFLGESMNKDMSQLIQSLKETDMSPETRRLVRKIESARYDDQLSNTKKYIAPTDEQCNSLSFPCETGLSILTNAMRHVQEQMGERTEGMQETEDIDEEALESSTDEPPPKRQRRSSENNARDDSYRRVSGSEGSNHEIGAADSDGRTHSNNGSIRRIHVGESSREGSGRGIKRDASVSEARRGKVVSKAYPVPQASTKSNVTKERWPVPPGWRKLSGGRGYYKPGDKSIIYPEPPGWVLCSDNWWEKESEDEDEGSE